MPQVLYDLCFYYLSDLISHTSPSLSITPTTLASSQFLEQTKQLLMPLHRKALLVSTQRCAQGSVLVTSHASP